MLARFPALKQVVGIAMEAPGRRKGGSEEMLYARQQEWSDEERAELARECERLSILSPSMKETAFSEPEFPEVEVLHFVSPKGERFSILSDDPRMSGAEFVFGDFSSGLPANRAHRRRAKAKARTGRKKKDCD